MRRPNAHTSRVVPQLARARAGVERELARVERVALGRGAGRRGEGRHRRGLLDDERVVEIQEQGARHARSMSRRTVSPCARRAPGEGSWSTTFQLLSSSDPEEPAALHVALEAGALQAVERHVEALADEGGDGAALQRLGDRERALLVAPAGRRRGWR